MGPVEKIETHVDVPQDLDLSPWLESQCGGSSSSSDSGSPTQDSQRAQAARQKKSAHYRHQGAQYKLYAAVNHSGSLSFGHYTAHASVGQGKDKLWFHFNDAKVTRADPSEIGTG